MCLYCYCDNKGHTIKDCWKKMVYENTRSSKSYWKKPRWPTMLQISLNCESWLKKCALQTTFKLLTTHVFLIVKHIDICPIIMNVKIFDTSTRAHQCCDREQCLMCCQRNQNHLPQRNDWRDKACLSSVVRARSQEESILHFYTGWQGCCCLIQKVGCRNNRFSWQGCRNRGKHVYDYY